jgi:ribonucleotide monophosphatase NagD (HAD superfamily)
MIGDNPSADIRGANAAGPPWHSILVRSGVFSGSANDPVDPAHTAVDNVSEAIEFILNEQGLERSVI